MFKSFLQKHWFGAAVALLLSVVVFNVGRYHNAMFVWVKGFFQQELLVDAPQWRKWADTNRNFFAPLAEGTCVALVRQRSDSTATVLTKTTEGVSAERTSWLHRRSCRVYFGMDAGTAEKILSVRIDQGDSFWDTWKQLVRNNTLQVYTLGSPEELKTDGVTPFLQAIDVQN